MPNSGVRSSWLTSETKSRIRASDADRSAKARSSWPSMVLSDAARCPISVPGEARTGTRRVRSPSAIAAAVCSIRRSGRRPRPRANQPTAVSRTSSTAPPIRLLDRSWAIVASASVRGAAASTVPFQPTVGRATARQRPEPSAASGPPRTRRRRSCAAHRGRAARRRRAGRSGGHPPPSRRRPGRPGTACRTDRERDRGVRGGRSCSSARAARRPATREISSVSDRSWPSRRSSW